jgi:HK97 family phage major capsid protein
MSTYAQIARDKRNEAIGKLQLLLNTAATESRDLTAEEAEMGDRMEADVKRYTEEEARATRVAGLFSAAEEFRADVAPRVESARQERRDPTDSEMLREMFRGERRSFESSTREEYRALQSAGGSAIPTTFQETVTVYLRTLSPMFRDDLFTVLNTPTGNPITLPRLTADPAHGGTLTAEAGGINELDPTLSSVQLDSYKYGVTTLWSAELGIDNVINLPDLIARASARELSIDIGSELTTANGSSKPNGIVNAAGNGGTASGTTSNTSLDTFLGPIDLIDLKYTLASGYRQVGTYMVSTTALAKMRKFRDSNKQFLFQPSLIAGVPDQFDGSTVVENPAMAAVASASKSVLFGDLSRYFVRRMPTRIDVSSEYKFNTDQLAIRVIERVDGDLVDTAAVNYLISANT